MSLELISDKITLLKDRAQMLSKARSFFEQRGVLEVDCPFLSRSASVDTHIDLVQAQACGQLSFLHTSPEYAMKRLLSMGMGDIYQLGHVFRDFEVGSRHNPEFMMAEWYRLGFNFDQMIKETIEFIEIFLGTEGYEVISYRDALYQYAGFDYLDVDSDFLAYFLRKKGFDVSPEIRNEGEEALLNQILALCVEPFLGSVTPTVLAYYPASQAALAKTIDKNGERVAERFEVYFKGVELANGYHELTDAKEQRARFHSTNHHRKKLGKNALPIDEAFLNSLEKGIPDCCGVAVGFDRLMMLRHSSTSIGEVIAFSWNDI